MSCEQRNSAAADPTPAEAPFEEKMISQVPADVRDAARRAFASRDRAAQVLDLASDSLLDPVPPTGPRRLVFGTGRGPLVHVAVPDAGAGRIRLEIAGDARDFEVLEVRVGTDVAAVEPSGNGSCTAGPVGHGLLTVIVAVGDARFQTAVLRV